VGATLLLFVFHAAMVFSPAPFYHIRNHELSMTMLVAAGFVSLWHMPLFFLLAGWSLQRSLERRGARGLVRERLRRLAVPLVAGCVVFMPVIKYLELSSGLDLNYRGLRASEALQAGFRLVIPEGLPLAPEFGESFLAFLPTFFTRPTASPGRTCGSSPISSRSRSPCCRSGSRSAAAAVRRIRPPYSCCTPRSFRSRSCNSTSVPAGRASRISSTTGRTSATSAPI
jgi:hypothetical protein